jgi:hypothetical protein
VHRVDRAVLVNEAGQRHDLGLMASEEVADLSRLDAVHFDHAGDHDDGLQPLPQFESGQFFGGR